MSTLYNNLMWGNLVKQSKKLPPGFGESIKNLIKTHPWKSGLSGLLGSLGIGGGGVSLYALGKSNGTDAAAMSDANLARLQALGGADANDKTYQNANANYNEMLRQADELNKKIEAHETVTDTIRNTLAPADNAPANASEGSTLPSSGQMEEAAATQQAQAQAQAQAAKQQASADQAASWFSSDKLPYWLGGAGALGLGYYLWQKHKEEEEEKRRRRELAEKNASVHPAVASCFNIPV